MTAGACIENWVPGVPFPPADDQKSKKQGIKDLGVRHARALAEGLVDSSINTCAKRVDKQGKSYDRRIINDLSLFF